MAKETPLGRPCLSDEDFAAVCEQFEAIGDQLCDEQMLALADAYHAMLRRRRGMRARMQGPRRPPGISVAEPGAL